VYCDRGVDVIHAECRVRNAGQEGYSMIQNYKRFRDFEKELLKRKNRDLAQKYAILEAMYEEAIMLGAFPLKNPMEGVETDVKIAKVVNSV